MKKIKNYMPWLIAGGAIVFAVGVHRFYASKILLELPVYTFMNGKTKIMLPTATKPFFYNLKSGEKVALYAVEAVEAIAANVV